MDIQKSKYGHPKFSRILDIQKWIFGYPKMSYGYPKIELSTSKIQHDLDIQKCIFMYFWISKNELSISKNRFVDIRKYIFGYPKFFGYP